jgi:hypothetical protein
VSNLATVINNPAATTDDANNTGVIFAVLLLLALVFALVYWGVPNARNVFSPNLTVPRNVDVNVNTPAVNEGTTTQQ